MKKLVQVVFAETTIKFARYKNLLLDLMRISSKEEDELLHLLSRAADNTVQTYLSQALYLVKHGEDEDGLLNTFIRSLQALQTLQIIDELFPTISQVSPEPETSIFVEMIFPHYKYKLSPIICFPRVGEFSEYDIAAMLRQEMREQGLPAVALTSKRILHLPKTEYKNPLLWVNLVHEMSHVLEEKNLGETQSVSRILCPEGFATEEYKWWVREFCADLVSLQLLGPAYFCAYVSFNLTQYFQTLNTDTFKHPSPAKRVSIMNGILSGSSDLIKSRHNEASSFYAKLFEQRLKLDSVCPARKVWKSCPKCKEPITSCPNCGFQLEIQPPTGTPEDLVEKIKQRVVEMNLRSYSAFPTDRIEQLAASLKEKLLICSHHKRKDGDKDPHQRIRDGLKETSLNEQQKKSKLRELEEDPNDVVEIINAAWLSHYRYVNETFPLFCDQDTSIQEVIEKVKEEISLNGELVKKSIEVSNIHGQFAHMREKYD